MMKYEIQHFHLIAHLKLAVLTFYDLITVVALILHPYHPVGQIGHLNNSICLQVGRAHFLICCVKVRISLVLNLCEFLPMGIP